MKKLILILSALSLFLSAKAQNLFPNKLDNCITEQFCLDCGDEKAGVKANEFKALVDDLNNTIDFGNASGKILFQVLIDSVGNGCVLSHTDNSKSKITKSIIAQFNQFKGWAPAKEKGKTQGRVSINIMAEVKDHHLTCRIDRVDMQAFKNSFDRPKDPEIFNKNYTYKNQHLKDYTITTWNSKNSNLPNNFNDDIAIDNRNTIWLTVDEGLVQFDGKSFIRKEQDITDKGKYFSYNAIAADNKGIKWTVGQGDIYSYDDKKWTLYSKKALGFNGAYHIYNNTNSGELLFCTDEGLHILKDNKWSTINKDNTRELPINRVYFAQRDSKKRLWIGTFAGSAMIDTDGKVTSFNNGSTVLKGQCITSLDEDENGNMYFGLYEYNPKDKKEVNRNEGIAICNHAGEFKQLTTNNSGMPFNHVSKVLYDKNEKVLWIATDRAGLVRYDLKDGWENYHNQNSDMPTSYIVDMAFDKNGVLYLATRQGLVRVQRN
ncbi:MAG: hypothetical protein WC615_18975 [Mucilaginibacter sp.]|jgi:hypothetical protein|uniref:ligand-binding sensor domain-containing protein n=1 Tax=Mucilaginibacter sp. TaxID=1882438 RepID=UPI003564577A